MRIVSCSPKPTDDTGYWYDIALELVIATPVVPLTCSYSPTGAIGTYSSYDLFGQRLYNEGTDVVVYDDPPYASTHAAVSGPGGMTFFGEMFEYNDYPNFGVEANVLGAGSVDARWTADLGVQTPVCVWWLDMYDWPAYGTVSLRGSNDNSNWTTLVTATYAGNGQVSPPFNGVPTAFAQPWPSYRYWQIRWTWTFGGGYFPGIQLNSLMLWSGAGGSGGSDVIVDLGPTPGATTTHTTDPTADDDSDAGYVVGSIWVNTATGGAFVAVDVTNGAAVWEPITGGGGAANLPWYDVQVDGTATGDGTTDDTAAIQAAITAATNGGTKSATIYFPPGIYKIAGALQDTGDRNGQILFPLVDIVTDSQITIHMLGAARPPLAWAGASPSPASYAVLKSTLTGASGTAAVFSAGQYGDWNNTSVIVENLICVAADNPSLTFWNLDICQGGGLRGVLGMCASNFATPGTIVEPTHSNSYFVKLPHYGESNYTFVDGVICGNFYTGLRLTDLAVVQEFATGVCKVGIEIPFFQHAAIVVSFHCSGTTVPIKVTGESFCDFLFASVEHAAVPDWPAWTVTTYDLDDPNDYLHGDIRWFGTSAPPVMAPDHTFTINGGANTSSSELGPRGATIGATVEDETTWGITPDAGASTEASAADHTHGSPANPVSADAVRALGSWEALVADGTTGPTANTSAYVEMTTPRTTTSGSLVDITGATTTITLQRAADIAVWLNCEVSASGAAADLALAINIDGTDHDEVTTHLAAGSSDNGVSGIVHRTATPLAPGTYTVKGRFRRASGAGTPAVDRADLLVISMGGGGPVMLLNEAQDDYLYGFVT